MNTNPLPSRSRWLPLLVLLASSSGCSSGAAESTPGDDAKAPDTAGDVGTVADTAETAVDALAEVIDASDAPVDTGPGCDATVCGGACVDTIKDPHNCGTCGRDCLGGTCTGGLCGDVKLASGKAVGQMTFTDTQVIFIDRTPDPTSLNDAIYSTSKDPNGASPTLLTDPGDGVLAIASDSGFLYYSTSTGIYSRGLTQVGGTSSTVTLAPYPKNLVPSFPDFFWAQQGPEGVKRLSGYATTTIASRSGSFVVDAGHLFLGVYANYGSPAGLYKYTLAGGSVTQITTTAGSDIDALATDDRYVYFVEGSTLVRLNKDGTGRTVVLTGKIASLPGYVLLNGYVYWSLRELGSSGWTYTLVRVPRDSTDATPERRSTFAHGPGMLATDGKAIFANESEVSSPVVSELRKLAP